MTTYVVKGARLLGGEVADLVLEDGVVVESGTGLSRAGAEVLDADGLVALPGLVDLHTHLREPGREDAETVETGTSAAALGGFTAVHAMANTDPVADTAGVVEQVWRLGREAGHCDGHPGGVGITRIGFTCFETLVADARRLIDECPCRSGCPSCVQSPKCGNLNEPLNKNGALELMTRMQAS